MLGLDLPDPVTAGAPAFADREGARRWVGGLPLAQAQESAEALAAQAAAVDAADLGAEEKLAMLDVLRRAALQVVPGLEARFTRKALPLPAELARDFDLARRLWRRLAVAYLRVAAGLAPGEAAILLHRATVVLRSEQYLHFLAAYDVPDELNRLLYGVLLTAEEQQTLRRPVADAELGFAEDSTIAGHLAWAFLLAAVDPYRLSLPQLAVANRAFSRWRDLAGFQSVPDNDPKARTVPLPFILPRIAMPDGALRWLEVRAVVRKIRKRAESLEAGESPESLKLGKDLSGAAAIALMRLLEKGLRPAEPPTHRRSLPVALAFGPEQAYVAIERRPLNTATLHAKSDTRSHERMAVFGFDDVSGLASAVNRAEPLSEAWELSGDLAWRAADAGSRLQAPVLVALVAREGEGSRLGVLAGLRVTEDGRLAGHLRLYADHPVAARLRPATPLAAKAPRVPAFLLTAEDGIAFYLVVSPTAGVRPQTGIALDDSPIEHLLVEDAVERGTDFVRFSCHAN